MTAVTRSRAGPLAGESARTGPSAWARIEGRTRANTETIMTPVAIQFLSTNLGRRVASPEPSVGRTHRCPSQNRPSPSVVKRDIATSVADHARRVNSPWVLKSGSR